MNEIAADRKVGNKTQQELSIKAKLKHISNSNIEEHLKHSLSCILDAHDINGEVYTRIKDVEKAIEKMNRKGYTEVTQLTDLIGAKVVTQDINGVYKLKDILEKQYKLHEVNDYIKVPLYSGYRSLHLDIEVNGHRIELQIKTKEMDKAQAITHDTLYKNNFTHENDLSLLINYLSNKIYEYYVKDSMYCRDTGLKEPSSNSLLDVIKTEIDQVHYNISLINNQKDFVTMQQAEQCNKFLAAKEDLQKHFNHMQGVNKEKLQLLNNVKNMIESIERDPISVGATKKDASSKSVSRPSIKEKLDNIKKTKERAKDSKQNYKNER